MIVKVCGITRREDAEAAVQYGASAIGFIFYPKSPRYIAPDRAREIGGGLDIWKVGVFVDETSAHIDAVMRSANLDIAQIYGDAQAVRVWRASRERQRPGLQQEDEALFLDSPGNGITFDWSEARNAAEKVIIAGGLDASNVHEAIRIAQPWGVDASSKLERSPGIKDHEKMRRFIKAAKEST